MKKAAICILMSQIFILASAQIDVYNSVTKENLSSEDGVIIKIEARTMYVEWNMNWSGLIQNWIVKGSKMVNTSTKSIPYYGETVYPAITNVISYTLEVSAPNYETTISNHTIIPSVTQGDFEQWYPYGSDFLGYRIDKDNPPKLELMDEILRIGAHDIFLIPKKTIIEGSLDLNVKNETTTELGLLTTKTIADGLGLTEPEVISLITSEQLKGKKIGDKYFVRKEDFDAFMKK